MAQQPPEIRNISANKIAATLKERRKYLTGEVMHYYHFLAEKVNVTASDKNELFDITRNDDGSVSLVVYKSPKKETSLIKYTKENLILRIPKNSMCMVLAVKINSLLRK